MLLESRQRPLEIKQTFLLLAARRFDFTFCCMQIKQDRIALLIIMQPRKFRKPLGLKCASSVWHNAFLESWNPQVGMVPLYWALQLGWLSTGQHVVGLEETAILDWISLVELIVSHIFLGGGSFKECKWNIIRPMFWKLSHKKTDRNS